MENIYDRHLVWHYKQFLRITWHSELTLNMFYFLREKESSYYFGSFSKPFQQRSNNKNHKVYTKDNNVKLPNSAYNVETEWCPFSMIKWNCYMQGEVAGGAHHWDEAFFFVFAFKICLRHRSVTSFLRGEPPPKINPWSARDMHDWSQQWPMCVCFSQK